MRRILIALTVLLAVGMTATIAMAQMTDIPVTTDLTCAPQGAHFAQNAVEPVCTLTTDATNNTVRVSCTGTDLQGVGNANAFTSLEVDASADILCRNPGNRNVVEPHTTPITEDAENTDEPSRNGRIAISPISATISESDVEREFTCPNPRWKEEVTTITVTRVLYTVTFEGETCPVFSATFPAP
jgi:hypothetical protein